MLLELDGKKVGRDARAIERVQHHHVVLLSRPVCPFHKRATIFDEQALSWALLVAKVTFGHANDGWVDFYAVDDGIGQYLVEGRGNGCAAQTNDQYLLRCRIQEQRAGHYAGVLEHHTVRIIKVQTSLTPVVDDLAEVHAALAVLFNDQYRRELGGLSMDQPGRRGVQQRVSYQDGGARGQGNAQ